MSRPPPLVPANVDLTDFPFMPLMIDRLKRSRAWLICKRRPELAFYMLNLWSASWHSRPSASLENDDEVLVDLAMCSPEAWEAIKADVLRGWVECDDGKLYHPVVAEQALSSWAKKVAQRQRTGAAREAAIQAKAAKRSAALGSNAPRAASGNSSRSVSGAVWPGGEKLATESEHASRPVAVPAPTSVADSVTEPATETVTDSVTGSKGEERDRENPPIAPQQGDMLSEAQPKRTKAILPGSFDRFWEIYPHKVGKDVARRSFDKVMRSERVTLDELTASVEAYKRSKPPMREWCNPSTWLNQGRWADQPAEPIIVSNGHGARPATVHSAFERFGVPVPEANVIAVVKRWRDGGPWHELFGPPPDNPACEVPTEWLERGGVRRGEPRPTREQRH